MKRTTFFVLSLLLLTTTAVAQQPVDTSCGKVDGETWLQCFNRLLVASGVPQPTVAASTDTTAPAEAGSHTPTPSSVPRSFGDPPDEQTLERVEKPVRTAAVQEIDNSLQQGLAAALAGGNANVLRELLPRFLASIGVDGVSNSDGELRVVHNFEPFANTQLSLEVVAKDAEVFNQIVDAFPEAERNDRKAALGENLGDFDDTTISLTFSIQKSSGKVRIGREPSYYGDLVTKLFDDVSKRARESKELQQQRRKDASLLITAATSVVEETPNRDEVQAALDRLAEYTLGNYRGFTKALADSKYREFGTLIDNQPQFLVTASQTLRDELVGPESFNASLSWQGGTANVNGLLEACPSMATMEDPSEPGTIANCYVTYLGAKEETLKMGWRWSLTAEYKKTDAWAFSRPDDNIELSLDESESWMAKAGIGKALRLDDLGTETSRFDFEATYDDVSGDPMRQSRFLATATVTQRLVDDMALSLSVVYANKPEYRGEVDEEFSARAGFKYKIQRKSDS